jgi:hypothetical protein
MPVAKMRQRELAEKRMEAERDAWFARARPMSQPKKTWREKRLSKEENGSEEFEGESHDSATDQAAPQAMEINMVFVITAEFCALEARVAEMSLGAEHAVFKKPEKVDEHMKPLYIKGHVDGNPMGCLMVDGGASVNIMPLVTFQKLRYREEDLKRTNMSLTGFAGKPAEARGIISKELTVGSKTMPTTFFVVDVKGRYNLLLGRDWIHANGCIPSTLHQCLIQWVSDQVEEVEADGVACIAMADAPVDMQNGNMGCLNGRDLTECDYVSVGKDGFVPINVKPTAGCIRLVDDVV